MSRLIDADLFIKALEETKANSTHYADKVLCDFAMEMVNGMPTAYDVDQVVEELENETHIFFNRITDELVPLKEVLEIVKRGGKNDYITSK